MAKIIRARNNISESVKRIAGVGEELKKESVDTLDFRNFLVDQLKKLFEAADIKMPNIVYHIEFTGPYETIRVYSCGLSWTIINKNNTFLYFLNFDIIVKSPIAVTIPIFFDILTMLGYNDDGNLEYLIKYER